MEEKYLMDICNPKQWKTIPKSELIEDGEFPVYGANGIIGRYNKYNHENPTVLITCRGATCGNIHMTVPQSYINGNAMSLDELNESKCKKEYLYYFLKYYDLSKIISGTAQPQITINGLKKVKVKLYSIEKQEKIVDELNKLNKVISLKKSQLEELSSFIKSQFVEMFGDIKIKEKMKNVSVYFSRGKTPNYVEKSNIKVISQACIYWDEFKYEKAKYQDENKALKSLEKMIENGDVLITSTGTGTLGRCNVYYGEDHKYMADSHVSILRLNYKEVNPIFFKYYFMQEKVQKELYAECVNGSTNQIELSKDRFLNFRILIPEIILQNQFSEIVKQIDKQKFESMIQLDKEDKIVLTNIIKDTFEKIAILYEILLKKYFKEGK